MKLNRYKAVLVYTWNLFLKNSILAFFFKNDLKPLHCFIFKFMFNTLRPSTLNFNRFSTNPFFNQFKNKNIQNFKLNFPIVSRQYTKQESNKKDEKSYLIYLKFLLSIKRFGKSLNLNLGIPLLIPEWKRMFKKEGLSQDILAGLSVATIALPLSLAISLASGVAPEVGLVSALVGGTVGALFGGTTLAVTGPAAALSVLVAPIVLQHGMSVMLFVGMATGFLQLITGIFKMGSLIKIIPQSVISGFLYGVGAIIFTSQLTKILGLPPVVSSNEGVTVIDTLLHCFNYIGQSQPETIILASITFLILYLLPKFTTKLPASVVGVTIASVVNHMFNFGAPTVGLLPTSLPALTIPSIPSHFTSSIIFSTFIIYAIATLDSLMASSAASKLQPKNIPKPHPNQEIIGQGLSNIATSLFGGIPVVVVIIRTSLNIQAGATSRRASLIHVLALMGSIYWLTPLIASIPISSLSGILLSVAFRLLHPHEFKQLIKISLWEALPFITTFVTIMFSDLVVGVEVGTLTALFVSLIRNQLTLFSYKLLKNDPSSYIITMSGNLNFLSALSIQKMNQNISAFDGNLDNLSLDFTNVISADSTGASMIANILEELIDSKKFNKSSLFIIGISHQISSAILNSTKSSTVQNFLPKSL